MDLLTIYDSSHMLSSFTFTKANLLVTIIVCFLSSWLSYMSILIVSSCNSITREVDHFAAASHSILKMTIVENFILLDM
jgi:hypothetical protein